MRERITKALYEHWVAEDFAHEYAPWEMLGDKDTWLSRADAVITSLSERTPQTAPSYEQQGTAYDPPAPLYEQVGRKQQP